MSSRPVLLLALSAAAFSALSTGCGTPRASLTPRYESMKLEGSVKLNNEQTGISGEATADQLGLGDADNGFGIKGDLKWGGFYLALNSLDMSYSGTGSVDGEIPIPGGGNLGNVNVTTPVSSSLELKYASAAAIWDFVPSKTVDAGIGLGLSWADFRSEFVDQTNNIDAVRTSEQSPVPLVAAMAGVELGRFRLGALGQAFKLKVSGVDMQLIDLDATAQYRVFTVGGTLKTLIAVGYRFLDAEANYEQDGVNVDTDLRFTGPYVGVTLML